MRALSITSGIILLLLGGLFLLGSFAPGPFQGLVGLVYALALLITGVAVLRHDPSDRVYFLAAVLPLLPIIYALAARVVGTTVTELADNTWWYFLLIIVASGAAGTTLALRLR